MLEIENLKVTYGADGAISAIKGISLKIKAKEIYAVIGANGAGKTSLLTALAGITDCKADSIKFDNIDIKKLSPQKRVSLGLSLVPEGRKIFSKMTVLENLELGAFIKEKDFDLKLELEKVYSLFPVLFQRKNQQAGTLSGGEQQMLAIGRSLMSTPKLLLMDEPSMGVAPILVDRIFEKIVELNRDGLTVMLVEQNASRALEIAKDACVLELGKILITGKAIDLLNDERVIEAYLG